MVHIKLTYAGKESENATDWLSCTFLRRQSSQNKTEYWLYHLRGEIKNNIATRAFPTCIYAAGIYSLAVFSGFGTCSPKMNWSDIRAKDLKAENDLDKVGQKYIEREIFLA